MIAKCSGLYECVDWEIFPMVETKMLKIKLYLSHQNESD